jgi:hypothetical protein
MAAKLARLTHKIAIQLHLVAESCTICSSRSGGQSGNFLIHPRKLQSHIQSKVASQMELGCQILRLDIERLQGYYDTCLTCVLEKLPPNKAKGKVVPVLFLT